MTVRYVGRADRSIVETRLETDINMQRREQVCLCSTDFQVNRGLEHANMWDISRANDRDTRSWMFE